jgi:predicted nucleotidyltransferase
MAEIQTLVDDKIQSFLQKLRHAGYQITRAYVFGSYVSGRIDEWSDIDIAVVSPQISDDRFEERICLTEIALSIDDRIEPLPFSIDGFNDEDPLVRQIKNKGILLE